MPCPACQSERVSRDGIRRNRQRMACHNCGRHFTADLDSYISPTPAGEHIDPQKPRRTYPDGWQPGATLNGNSGTITTPASEGPLDMTKPMWEALMERFGLDPALYRVIEPVTMKSWDAMTGISRQNAVVTMYAYRATIVSRVAEPDLEELYREAKEAEPRHLNVVGTYTSSLVVNLCDWQIGKGEGDGPEGTLRRILDLGRQVLARAWQLRVAGYGCEELVVAGLGDLVEGCTGFYAMQEHLTKLDRRNQTKVVRRALRDLLMLWAPEFSRIRVTAVGGNHGENRKGGQVFTTFNDNDDVSVFEQVSDILAANPAAFGHIQFSLPSSRLAVALEVQGHLVAWTHGHVAKGGAGVAAMWRWWKDQAHGRYYEGVADADVLVCGHFHTFEAREEKGRLLLLCPTIDGGSEWYSNRRGVRNARGTLSFVMTPNGWSGLEILGAREEGRTAA